MRDLGLWIISTLLASQEEIVMIEKTLTRQDVADGKRPRDPDPRSPVFLFLFLWEKEGIVDGSREQH